MPTQLDPIGSQNPAGGIQRIAQESAANSIAMQEWNTAINRDLQMAGMQAATENAAGAIAQQQTLSITELAKKNAKDVSEAFKA